MIGVPDIPRALLAYREQNRNTSDYDADGLYFASLERLQACKKDASQRLHYAMVCLSYIEPFVRYQTREYGSVPPSIPAISEALTFHAVNGARGQLENIREIIEFLPALDAYKPAVAESFLMLDLAAKVRSYLMEHPGWLQNGLKRAIGASDGRLLSRVLHYMEVGGQIERKRHEKTWELYLTLSRKLCPG